MLALFQVLKSRDLGILVGLPGPDQIRLTELLGLLESLVSPRSRDDEVDVIVRLAEVQGEGGELGGGAALEEEDGVVVFGDSKEGSEVGLGLVDDG